MRCPPPPYTHTHTHVPCREQKECFLNLEAPVQRVCGFDTPFPLSNEPFYVPDKYRCFEAIKASLEF